MVNSTNLTITTKVFCTLLLLLLFLTANTATVKAEGTYGWFVPKVEYVDDNIGPCPAGTAAIDFTLVEGDTLVPLTESIGNWKINIRESESSNAITAYQLLSTQNQSNILCFDPTTNGIQVSVFDSTNYHELLTSTIFPDPTNITSLEQMKGSHYRGYVHLVPKSTSVSPYVESHCVAMGTQCIDFASSTPKFVVKNNKSTSPYGSNGVTDTYLYIQDTLNATGLITKIFPDDCTNLYCYLDIVDDLPEGYYSWATSQEFNGNTSATRVTGVPWMWTFSDIPTSGLTPQKNFTIDKTNPTSVLSDFTIANLTATASDPVDLNFENTMSDDLTGIGSRRIYIEDNTGAIVYDNTIISPAAIIQEFVPGLERAITYKIFAETTDFAGNTEVSLPVSYTIPTNFDLPEIVLYNGYAGSVLITDGVRSTLNPTSNVLYGKIVNTTNPLPLTLHRLCWSINRADIDDYVATNNMTNVQCRETTFFVDRTWFGYFFEYAQNTPVDTDIYFASAVQNSLGWGYSNVGSFHTPVSPFAACTTCVPTVPTVALESSPRGSNNLNSRIFVNAGGYSPISDYGYCHFLSEVNRDAFDPSLPVWAAKLADPDECKSYGSLSSGVTLPFWPGWHIFTDLNPATTYYLKAFATNSTGSGYYTASSTTGNEYFDFGNVFLDINADPSEFNATANKYDSVDIDVTGIDWSSSLISSHDKAERRAIDMLVELTDSDGVTHTDTVAVSLQGSGRASQWYYHEIVTFNNLPLGNISVKTTLNPNNLGIYNNELNYPGKSNIQLQTELLADPTFTDTAAGSDTGSGSGVIVDPVLSIVVTPSTIRSGNAVDLNWEMLNTDNLECVIFGPNDFMAIGTSTYSFSPYDSNIPIGDIVTDSITTAVVNFAQIFRFECTYTPTGVMFTTEARVKVIGTPIEI
jgi:hypothetical protein